MKMPQREYVPSSYSLVEPEPRSPETAVKLSSQEKDATHIFTLEAIRPNLFRTTFISTTHPLAPHRSAPVPSVDLGEVKSKCTESEKSKTYTFGDITVNLSWTSSPLVEISLSGVDEPIHSDLPYRSYAIDGDGIAHYTKYKKNTLHAGLGEKPAPLNLSNRSFRIGATDSFGYDVYRTDPLYKHIPFLINATPTGCVGLFSTSHSRGFYSVGSEMDGLWGHYKVYRQEYGGLEEYVIVGRTIQEVVQTYAVLVGYPKLVPRWAFGYIAGGMKYSMLDEPRASEALMSFAAKLKHHDIPCSGFQLSSGYTVAETEPKTRNVFTWNRHRFPDPKGFLDAFHAQGIRVIANVKPYVLANHPEYNKLADAGAFFTDPRTQKNAVARLWSAGGGESGVGSHIDFTSAFGYNWWFEGVKALREVGIDVVWNDNNEYTIPDDDWECKLDAPVLRSSEFLDGQKRVGVLGRAIHAELMAKSSHDALISLDSGRRPFVLTRSATAGTMRYASSSWSGDNVTSWDSMRGSTALSLTAGMCLLQCYGHDVGGFEGPQPEPELLLRWVQLAAYSPRFAINCYKTSPQDNTVGDVIEPWMYPEITGLVRKAIRRRYEILPYLYSLALESHKFALPPQRWIGWGCEDDPEVWSAQLMDGETQSWLGQSLLVGSVSEPGMSKARMYLPKVRTKQDDTGFLNLNAPYQHLESGQWVELDVEWDTVGITVLAKVGTAIPVSKQCQTLSSGEQENEADLPLDDYRAVEIFPPQKDSAGRVFETRWYEDDGISANPHISSFIVRYSTTESEVIVHWEKENGGFDAPWKELHVILPVGDERRVTSPVNAGVKQSTGIEVGAPGTLPVIKLDYGSFRATKYDQANDVYTFKNIRFGASTAGQNRWKAPQAPAFDHGVSSDDSAISCPQGSLVAFGSADVRAPASEDCLFLDLFIPGKLLSNPKNSSVPVVLNIYGGAYIFGSKNLLDGTGPIKRANGQMIQISSNYRVGPFGFLAGSTTEEQATPNAGIWDQIVALEWIQKYAPMLGGNKDDVSIWGESAGAGSIWLHPILEGGKRDPLFKKAVIQSPALNPQWDRRGQIENAYKRFEDLSGCAGRGIACLRSVSADKLNQAGNTVNGEAVRGTFGFGPQPDGKLILQAPALEYAQGNYWKNLTSVISSHTANEAEVFYDRSVTSDETWEAYLRKLFPAAVVNAGWDKKITEIYKSPSTPGSSSRTQGDRVRDSLRDLVFSCNARTFATAYKDRSYNIQYSVGTGLHGSDVAPTYSNVDGSSPAASSADKNTAGYQSYLVSHALTGDPNNLRLKSTTIQWETIGDGVGLEKAYPVLNAADSGFALIQDEQNLKSHCDLWLDFLEDAQKIQGYTR
ncbi:glycoside hydrolase family 31 protein [Aulographum hederae CBS 113979]|uniref:alpha-glucosidase n=1 Tax=Aulographum hederae CBS 113979 TaxID=1176131 RepID=A0A6G1GWN6_9PEZI|nr:glycoside hydrolase family 31 protein [Aulographum hederae CBS 113979]